MIPITKVRNLAVVIEKGRAVKLKHINKLLTPSMLEANPRGFVGQAVAIPLHLLTLELFWVERNKNVCDDLGSPCGTDEKKWHIEYD